MSKKLISIILSLFMFISVASITAFADSANSLGDVSGDGKITAADARTILRFSAKLQSLDDAQTAAADIDGNGKVTASDARIALRISAKLDSIDNYITEEPPVEDDKADLGTYMGKSLDDITAAYGEFELYADYSYSQDNALYILVDEENVIYDITILGEYEGTIYGISYGSAPDEAYEAFEKAGFSMFDEFSGYNYETGEYIGIGTDEDGERVEYISVWYDYFLMNKDLGLIIGYQLEEWLVYIPELEPVTDAENMYTSEFVVITCNDNGTVYDILLGGECGYNVYGVECGMSVADATAKLEELGFVMEDGYGYNELFDEEIILIADDIKGETVVGVSLYSQIAETVFGYGLEFMIGIDINSFLEIYPEFIQDNEDTLYYYSDDSYVCVDENGRICNIKLSGDNGYTVYGVGYGMAAEEAIETLAYSGFEMISDTQGYNSFFEENITLEYDENDCVVSIEFFIDSESYFEEEYDLGFYAGFGIELLLDSFPGITANEGNEGIYSDENSDVTVMVDENGIIFDITVFSGPYTIYGIGEGTSAESAFELLESAGFVKDDFLTYENYMTGESILIGFDVNNEFVEWIDITAV